MTNSLHLKVTLDLPEEYERYSELGLRTELALGIYLGQPIGIFLEGQNSSIVLVFAEHAKMCSLTLVAAGNKL